MKIMRKYHKILITFMLVTYSQSYLFSARQDVAQNNEQQSSKAVKQPWQKAARNKKKAGLLAAGMMTTVTILIGSIYGAFNHLSDKPEFEQQKNRQLERNNLIMDLEKRNMDLSRGANGVQDPYGNTPLIVSVIQDDSRSINDLVKAGADINLGNTDGTTPLIMAVKKNNKRIIEQLLNLPTIMINQPDGEGSTPLVIAVEDGNFDVVKLLVEHDADLFAKGGSQYTPRARAVTIARGYKTAYQQAEVDQNQAEMRKYKNAYDRYQKIAEYLGQQEILH